MGAHRPTLTEMYSVVVTAPTGLSPRSVKALVSV